MEGAGPHLKQSKFFPKVLLSLVDYYCGNRNTKVCIGFVYFKNKKVGFSPSQPSIEPTEKKGLL